jgi:hypothetical protein
MSTTSSDLRAGKLIRDIRSSTRALEALAASEDPWVAAEMVKLAHELEAAADRTVARLRAAKYTWADIGYAFGTTRQGAFNRWAKSPLDGSTS